MSAFQQKKKKKLQDIIKGKKQTKPNHSLKRLNTHQNQIQEAGHGVAQL
jgi:hypothetical protein